MANYQSKPGKTPRQEGIAVIDVDLASENFNGIVEDIPLSPDTVAHHIFYNNDLTKAYVTAFGKSVLHIFDMQRFPEGMKTVAVPDCRVGEDLVFADDGNTW